MIDAVITYVDLNDENWKKSYEKFVSKPLYEVENRFRSYGCLDLQIKLIRKNMKFVDKIFVVVSSLSQVPEDVLKLEKVYVITHSQIIPKRFIPCFNSCTIEMFLYNIKALKNNFLYFNDDVFVVKHCEETDFIEKGIPHIKYSLKKYEGNVTPFEQNIINSHKIFDNTAKYFIKPSHFCYCLNKSHMIDVWIKHKNEIEKSLTRTRHRSNINFYAFINYEILNGNSIYQYVTGKYVESIDSFEKASNEILNGDTRMICINDNDKCIDFKWFCEETRRFLECMLEEKEFKIRKKEQKIEISNLDNTHLKVALCAIAKNENLYIREWVEWYKNLGISKIFLYDNNELDGERFEEVINDYIEEGFVEVIDRRGVEKGCFYDEEGINLQPKCYIECYKTKVSSFDWICYFDVDEFLNFRDNYTLDSFLNQKMFSTADTILIPWVQYDDNNLLFYEDLPVVKRFTHISKTKKQGVKSIVRCGKEFNDEYKGINCLIHCFLLNGRKIIKSCGQQITSYNKSNWYTLSTNQIIESKAVLNHYKTKSTEEFIKRHLGRYWGTGHKFTDLGPRTIDDIIEQYFIFCDETSDKVNLFKLYNNKDYQNKIIVNFTTWKERDWCCEKMLTYFLKQTKKADEIICWLSKEEYNGIIPETINICLEKKLLTKVCWCDGNTFGHKRWDSLKYFNNAYNIFIDDDIYYPANFIEKLIEVSNKYDNKSIVCYYGRTVDYVDGKRINISYENSPSYKNVLYSGLCCIPPNTIPLYLFNYTKIRDKYCERCDDSWINGWVLKLGIKIVGYTEWYSNCLKEIENTKKTSVWRNYNSKEVNNTTQKYVNLVNVIKLLHIEEISNEIWPNINIDKFSTV